MKNLLYVSMIVLCFSGCGKQEFDPKIDKEGKKICVNAIITTDSSWSVSVTRSRAIVDDGPYFEYDDLKEASVVVLEDGVPITTLIRNAPASALPFEHYPFVSDKLPAHAPKNGKTYKLMVTAPELGTATSTCVLPAPVQIQRIEVGEDRPVIQVFDQYYHAPASPAVPLTVYFEDPPEPGNYYRIAIRITSLDTGNYFFPLGQRTEFPLVTNDDRFYNPVNPPNTVVPGEEIYREVSFGDNNINGEQVRVQCFANISGLSSNRFIFEVALYTMTKDLFEYIASNDLQISSKQNPLAQPAVVHNNIENGVGVFGGYSKSVLPMK